MNSESVRSTFFQIGWHDARIERFSFALPAGSFSPEIAIDLRLQRETQIGAVRSHTCRIIFSNCRYCGCSLDLSYLSWAVSIDEATMLDLTSSGKDRTVNEYLKKFPDLRAPKYSDHYCFGIMAMDPGGDIVIVCEGVEIIVGS